MGKIQGLRLVVISNYDLKEYYKDIQEFWNEGVTVEEAQFSTCIDEEGDIHYSTQFIYSSN